jgi:hypothetical protein
MKAKRFIEAQIIGVPKKAEAGAKTKDLCRRHGISEATFYNWKTKYAGMAVSEARIDKGHRCRVLSSARAYQLEHAEQRLADEIVVVNCDLQRNANPPPRFADCAARYRSESRNKRSAGATAWHVRLLTSYIGTPRCTPHPRRHTRALCRRSSRGRRDGYDHQSQS